MASSNNVIRAHFDGERIVLDDPVELKRDARLSISILTNLSVDDPEREAWLNASSANLDSAYNGDADSYSLASIKEFNPDYLISNQAA